MLSISPPIAAAQGSYFGGLAREDYYTEGGEPPGIWCGRGLGALGLAGKVDSEVFQHLLLGYSPDGRTPLVQNAGELMRQAAWDLTFSAPKTLSVFWSQADERTRQIIQEIQARAVAKALDYLEDVAAFTRRGHAGQQVERAFWIMATFLHGTSRAQDPQLHTHVVLLNLALRADGSTGTILSQPVFRHKMAAGALYRAELALLLQERLGLNVERVKSWFEIEGVAPALVAEFSKRRKEIEQFLRERGQEGPVAAKEATLLTRSVKQHLPREVLFRQWREIGRALNWSTTQAEELVDRDGTRHHSLRSRQELVSEALFTVTEQQSHFAGRDLVRRMAEAGQGAGLGAAGARLLAQETLANPEVVTVGPWKGECRFTTREMLQMEDALLASAQSTRHSRSHVLVEPDRDRFATLSEEQRVAVRHITTAEGSVKVVSGLAGTGKSSLLKVARILWQESGRSVWGASLTGKAARGLEASAGIPSVTLARLLPCIAENRSPFRDDPSPLDAKTVLVVDEAGMLGTRQMKILVDAVHQAGAKLVLVGDAKQLQPIEAGGPFRALGELLGEAKLVHIQRQRDEWARRVVLKFADGAARFALNDLAAHGLLTVSPTREDSVKRLIDDWRHIGASHPEDHLILASQNESVRLLNRAAQAVRLARGELSETGIAVGAESIRVGDRILFTRNSTLHGVSNGTLGSVTAIHGVRLRVALDTSRSAEFSLADYDHVRLGYAVTTHKAQGMTAEHVYVLAAEEIQDREITYVQASRACGSTRFYLDRESGGDRLESIILQMATSHQKLLAREILDACEQPPNSDAASGRVTVPIFPSTPRRSATIASR